MVESSADPHFGKNDPVVSPATIGALLTTVDSAHAGAGVGRADAAGMSPLEAMTIGTAGFTAGVVDPRDGTQRPDAGESAGHGDGRDWWRAFRRGVFGARGYPVTALTGKDSEHDYLRSLGAQTVVARQDLELGTRPLEKATWAGAIDAVGGPILAWLTRTMLYGGSIAATGLTAGTELHTTVLPFILRGVKLLGIDSVLCPMDRRKDVWRHLALDMKPGHLQSIGQVIGLDDLPQAFESLAGRARDGSW
jgi:NADPH2:quinone reductase